jgi:hypothetical protein
VTSYGVLVSTPLQRALAAVRQTAKQPELVAAVSTVHWGSYAGLRAANAAIHHWCQANGRLIAGPSWDVYGDWSDDRSKVRTDVYYLLAE